MEGCKYYTKRKKRRVREIIREPCLLTKDKTLFIHHIANSLSCFEKNVFGILTAKNLLKNQSRASDKTQNSKGQSLLFQLLITSVHIHFRLETVVSQNASLEKRCCLLVLASFQNKCKICNPSSQHLLCSFKNVSRSLQLVLSVSSSLSLPLSFSGLINANSYCPTRICKLY